MTSKAIEQAKAQQLACVINVASMIERKYHERTTPETDV